MWPTLRLLKVGIDEAMRWAAPHPPGTWLNLDPGVECDLLDQRQIRFRFPMPNGLALARMRAYHIGSPSFWQRLGFGYATHGSGEGRW